jgi:asparagine synthase (glutamine-hydrolysing)
MCGIAGMLHFDEARKVDRAMLERMTKVLSHRGPDGENYYVANHVGLGHRRLAVIDLSTGSQPMTSLSSGCVIVFNGEIYNFVELRDKLKAKGHIFHTASDTEVVLKAYEEWGFECQSHFNGMWAFAIWDVRNKWLFISRDRLGEKPLHYSVRGNSLFFGSEIKSILAADETYEKASELMHIYLSLGYVPAPHTFYKGISKLLPGHFLVARDGRLEDRVHWDLPPISEKDMRKDAPAIYREFGGFLRDSVEIRMRSDVPYGAFLSGGLDSSSVVAAMAEVSEKPVETFTIGFAEKAFDERDLAKQVAIHCRTNHHEQLAKPETFDESLKAILAHFDEPFGDASAIPVGMVSRLAKQRVTMVLTGDGGDEVLSGYTSYVTEKLTGQYRAIPGAGRTAVSVLIGLACMSAKGDLRYKLNRLARFLRLAGVSFEERFLAKLSMLGPALIRNLISASGPQISIEEYLSDFFAKCPFADPFYKLMFFNLKVSLPDDMLTKVDRMSMAHSLEARVPFLDHRLVELTYGVDKCVKLPGFERKNLLKRTFENKLPPALVKAPKMPFSVPLREWFKQEQFEERLQDLGRGDFGLNRAVIQEIVAAGKSGHHDYGDFIWRMFVLKQWYEKRVGHCLASTG